MICPIASRSGKYIISAKTASQEKFVLVALETVDCLNLHARINIQIFGEFIMNADIKLAQPVILASGISIRPPAGWIQEGFVTDNPHWLKPKSRFSWHPPAVETAVLHWQLSEVSLPGELVSSLVEILQGPVGWISVDELQALHPMLIRMSLADITRAKICAFEHSEKLLGVEYFYPDSTEFGIVHYAPTGKSGLGEVQILGYEGREPEYGQYWSMSHASMATFSWH